MSSYPVGTKIRIARVLDERELLDYLVSIKLNIHEEYEIIDAAAYEGPITIKMTQKLSATKPPARFLSINCK